MYLQVTTLSDIADANEQRILDEAFKGQKLSDRYSRLKWTRQPVVTTKQRNLWKAALEAAFTSSGMVLKHPLGEWTGPPTQVWRNFYNPGTNRVVTSMTGSTIRFTEYTVSNALDTMRMPLRLLLHQCTCLLKTLTGTLFSDSKCDCDFSFTYEDFSRCTR
jgi:hypothetical protein